jgi:hypothetical protein
VAYELPEPSSKTYYEKEYHPNPDGIAPNLADASLNGRL